MNILICEPNLPPYIKSIKGKYGEIQAIIGDNVKALPLNHPSIIVMCNEDYYENKSNNGTYRFNIPGTFVFLGRENNRLRSLSKDEINEIIHTIRKEDFTLV